MIHMGGLTCTGLFHTDSQDQKFPSLVTVIPPAENSLLCDNQYTGIPGQFTLFRFLLSASSVATDFAREAAAFVYCAITAACQRKCHCHCSCRESYSNFFFFISYSSLLYFFLQSDYK